MVGQGDTAKQLVSLFTICGLCLSKDGLIVCYLSFKGHDIVTPHRSSFPVVRSKFALLANEGAARTGVATRAFDLQ
jgi:hypothetical protein